MAFEFETTLAVCCLERASESVPISFSIPSSLSPKGSEKETAKPTAGDTTVAMMDILSLSLYAFVVALAYESWWLFRSPLKGIPGPFLAKLTNIWRLVLVARKQSFIVLRDMHKQYGSVVRIGPNVLSLSNPQWIKIVYSTCGDFEKVRSSIQR